MAVSLAGCEGLSTSSTYEAAQNAYDQGQYRIANAHLNDVLAKGGAEDRVRKLQLDLMLKYGDGNRAVAALGQLSKDALSEQERRLALAHALLLQGSAQRVIKLYDPILLDDHSEQDLRMLLWALVQLNDEPMFEKRLDYALGRYPDSAHINALAANRLYDLKKPSEAGAYAVTAIINGKDNLEARLVAGRKAIFDGNLETAIEHYKKAHTINPLMPLPLANVAGLQLDLGQVDAAADTLKIAVDNHSEYPFLQWQLARYRVAIGNFQGAREAKDRAVRAFGNNAEFILLTAQIEAGLGNKALALDNYRRFVREAGELPQVMAKIAELEG
ncbi:MAG: tetratricopeptide repeat protein [Erythrobacter sp.]|uniref:tetratricopeptide repeat protein n=1 Tax=Erythrobacter sp. TaxID=1042 RepID=UPI0032669B58